MDHYSPKPIKDQNHLHHKLLRTGLTNRQILLVVYCITGIAGAAVVIWGVSQVEDGIDQAVKVLVARFGNDYVKANPKGKSLASSHGEH